MSMRQNQKRLRGRNRKGPNPLTRSYESNGPDVKIRGTALHIAEKYVALARDAQAASDPILAESYLQHAEHYYRIIAAAQANMAQPQPFVREDQYRDEEDEEETRSLYNGPVSQPGAPQPIEMRGPVESRPNGQGNGHAGANGEARGENDAAEAEAAGVGAAEPPEQQAEAEPAPEPVSRRRRTRTRRPRAAAGEANGAGAAPAEE